MIRTFLLAALLSLPGATEASTVAGKPFPEWQSGFQTENAGPRRGFARYFSKKILQKHFKKGIRGIAQSREADGSWLLTASVGACVLGFLSLLFIFYTGFYPALILGALGLLLAVTGLVLASRWRDPATPRWVAILSIVANAALLGLAIALL